MCRNGNKTFSAFRPEIHFVYFDKELQTFPAFLWTKSPLQDLGWQSKVTYSYEYVHTSLELVSLWLLTGSHQGLTLRSNDVTVTRTSKKKTKKQRVCKQKNNFARASRVFVHFFAVSARLRRENGYFRVLWRTQTSNDEILFLFLNLDVVLRNSTSGGFAYIWQSKWVGIIAIKTERMQIHILSDVLTAVASLDLKVPGRPGLDAELFMSRN